MLAAEITAPPLALMDTLFTAWVVLYLAKWAYPLGIRKRPTWLLLVVAPAAFVAWALTSVICIAMVYKAYLAIGGMLWI